MTNPINDFTVTPFQFYCQHVLPLVYDQSLSYYEVLCKMQVKLNEVINSQNNLSQAFLNLKAWIDSQLKLYVDGQLNEWLNDGTLQSLITNMLNIEITFETTTEMLNSKTLIKGMKVKTLGYLTKGDCGISNFYITDESINKFSFNLQNNLKAYLMNETINDTMLGLEPNSDLSLYNSLFTQYKEITFNKNYQVDATRNISSLLFQNYGLLLNQPITLNFNGQLTVIPNNKSRYNCMVINGKNITVNGLYINGERQNHTPSGSGTDEWGYNLFIYSSENININNYTGINPNGDNLTLAFSKNVFINNMESINARRNGISITSGSDYYLNDVKISGTKGTAPEYGIDIEPDSDGYLLDEIHLNNINIDNTNQGGLLITLMNYKGTNIPKIYLDNINTASAVSPIPGGIQYGFYYYQKSNSNVYIGNMISDNTRIHPFNDASITIENLITNNFYFTTTVENTLPVIKLLIKNLNVTLFNANNSWFTPTISDNVPVIENINQNANLPWNINSPRIFVKFQNVNIVTTNLISLSSGLYSDFINNFTGTSRISIDKLWAQGTILNVYNPNGNTINLTPPSTFTYHGVSTTTKNIRFIYGINEVWGIEF